MSFRWEHSLGSDRAAGESWRPFRWVKTIFMLSCLKCFSGRPIKPPLDSGTEGAANAWAAPSFVNILFTESAPSESAFHNEAHSSFQD
jgi:hypothetical protein